MNFSLFSDLAKSAFTYGFFSFVCRAVPFFLLPLFTRFLTPEDYGIIANFSVMLTILTPFSGLNISAAYAFIFYSRDRFIHEVYLGTILIFLAFVAVFQLIFFQIFKVEISSLFAFPSDWILIVPFTAAGAAVVNIMLTAWQVRKQASSFGIFQNTFTVFETGTAAVLIGKAGWNWTGRLFSRAFANVVFAVISIKLLFEKGWAKLEFNTGYLKHGLLYGLPLIPHSLSGVVNTTIDRIFITHMIGSADTGLYSVGYQVGAVIGMLTASFNQAFVPWLFGRLNEKRDEDKVAIVKFTYLYFAAILSITLMLGLMAEPFFNFFLGKAFKSASSLVLWIAMGFCFDGMYLMVCNYIYYAEKNSGIAVISFCGAMVNIVLNYLFIRANGAVGAAQATTITFFLNFIMVWIYSARVYPMPWFSFNKKSASSAS